MFKFTLDPKSDPDPPQRKIVDPDPDPPKVKRILTPALNAYIGLCTAQLQVTTE